MLNDWGKMNRMVRITHKPTGITAVASEYRSQHRKCDCCGVVMDGRNSRQEGALVLKAHALDMQGAPCADATRKLDLCGSCLYDVSNAVDTAMAAARSQAKEGANHE